MVMMTADEYPRGLKATLEGMAKLPSVFKKGGAVTAASASGICDGAAALVVASEEACSAQGMTPLARVVAWNRVGCDPSMSVSQSVSQTKRQSVSQTDKKTVSQTDRQSDSQSVSQSDSQTDSRPLTTYPGRQAVGQ